MFYPFLYSADNLYPGLTLALFVFWINLANNIDNTLAAYDFAIFTNSFY